MLGDFLKEEILRKYEQNWLLSHSHKIVVI